MKKNFSEHPTGKILYRELSKRGSSLFLSSHMIKPGVAYKPFRTTENGFKQFYAEGFQEPQMDLYQHSEHFPA